MTDERLIEAELIAISKRLGSMQSDLGIINDNIGAVDSRVDAVHSRVGNVDDNIRIVYDEVGKLAYAFNEYVGEQRRANRLGRAETKLIQIRQELDKKYGHYDVIRRTTTGILQADDLGIVKKSTISNATEEMMISAPGYWLAPCLVALAAWINDDQELAEKAVREAIKRNDEKTSLFFALVCRRADRKGACLKWVERYLANQNEEDLDRITIVILDAFASGLFGADSEGVISKQMKTWLNRLEEKPGFTEQQTRQWSDAINLKRKPLEDKNYSYLEKYSNTWPELEYIMEGANLHADMLEYLIGIFGQRSSSSAVKEQLDTILDSLVSDFDDEELPLRREEKFESFVVQYHGDEDRARQSMTIEQTAFDTHKDFTQLLTDAAMKPESSHSSVSTQKFAFALSKDWVKNAYNDVVAQNRMRIPNEIEINVDTFNDKTVDGRDEAAVLHRFNNLINKEKEEALAQCELSKFEQFCLYGGAGVAGLGLALAVLGNIIIGIMAVIAGVGAIIYHFSKKNSISTRVANIESQFTEKRNKGIEIIRATMAEIVDFRMEFTEKDKKSKDVTDFLDQITPEQYINQLAESSRRIMV